MEKEKVWIQEKEEKGSVKGMQQRRQKTKEELGRKKKNRSEWSQEKGDINENENKAVRHDGS